MRAVAWAARWSGPRVGTLGGSVQGAARESPEAERLQAGVALTRDVVGRQLSDRQRLEAMARVDDGVDVVEHPVADRIVVGRVGDDAVRGGELPVAGPPRNRGRAAASPEMKKSRKTGSAACSGLSGPYGSKSG